MPRHLRSGIWAMPYTPEGEVHWDYIRLALASVAKLAVIPVQDYLGLGELGPDK